MRSTVRWTIDLDMNVSMSKSTRRSGDQPVQLRIDGFNSRWMLSSTDECFHLGMNAFISESTHSSQNQHIHLAINAFTSQSTHSSQNQRTHLGINAFISGSTHSSRDQRIQAPFRCLRWRRSGCSPVLRPLFALTRPVRGKGAWSVSAIARNR